MSHKKPKKSPFAGLLAEKLKALDLNLKEAPPEDEKKTRAQEQRAKRSSDRHAYPNYEIPEEPDVAPLSDAELFEKSIREMAPEDVYRGKFAGEGPKLPPSKEDVAEARAKSAPKPSQEQTHQSEADPRIAQAAEESAREAVGEAREMRLFEKTVGRVDKVVRGDKYRRPPMPDPTEDAARRTGHAAFSSDSPESLTTPPLPKSGEGLNQVGAFDAAQRDLHARYKKRARQHEVSEINIRGDSVEDALRQVELFVHQQCKEKRRFLRIIHGRGLQSNGDPVLKPAILHWLEGPGFRYVRGYVPERNSAGDYGSLIVELERVHD